MNYGKLKRLFSWTLPLWLQGCGRCKTCKIFVPLNVTVRWNYKMGTGFECPTCYGEPDRWHKRAWRP